jgi:ribosomal protein S18 acetylase RimI-like enzyme
LDHLPRREEQSAPVTASVAKAPSFEPECWFVAGSPDGSLAGAALNWKEGFVKDLVVHPAHRRRGLGEALLHHTFRHFRARGARCVSLKAHGAELIGEVVQYEDTYRLCYIRGPEGIIIGLAEQLS